MLAACGFDPRAAQSDAPIVLVDGPVETGPCATNNGGCPIACTPVDGSAACYAPEDCGQVAALSNNSNATLYVGGNPSKWLTAFCHDGNEYLTVPASGNYGQYTAGGKSPGSDVRTSYAKLRVAPTTLLVDICDET